MKTLSFFCLLAIASGQTTVPDAQTIFAKHVQALGGDSAARIASQVRTGTYSFGAGNEPFPAEVQAKAPGKWQFTITLPGTEMLRDVFDGKTGWSYSSRGAEPMSDQERVTEDCAFNLTAMLNPGQYLASPTVKGPEKVNGRDVWVVDAKTPVGDAISARFDTGTGLLASIGNVSFDDYRPVDGVRVPFVFRVGEGRRQTEFKAASVRSNVAVADSLFEQQASGAGYRAALRAMTDESLNESLQSIEAGAARSVLAELHSFAPSDGRFLYDLIVSKGYKRGIEIGTAEGTSAIWMALAFKKTGGKLITIEMNEARAKVATENFRKAGLDQVVECRVNDAFKEIPALSGDFDFVFMDTGTALHKKFMDLLYTRVPTGGAITSHNANTLAQQMPDFLKAITTDPNLETRITRTPTGGFSVSFKKAA